jgi:autotransporter adhesin
MRIFLLFIGFLIMGVVSADGFDDHDHPTPPPPPPPVINNYHTEEITNITNIHILDDDALSDILAAGMAADAISFGTNTRKWQLGIGAGYHEGAEAFAVGVGKMVETEKMEFLFSLKGARSNSDWGVGIGATIQLD